MLISLQVASLETNKISFHIDLNGCPLVLEIIRDKLTTHRGRVEKQRDPVTLGFSYGRLRIPSANMGRCGSANSDIVNEGAESMGGGSANLSPLFHIQEVKRLLIPRRGKHRCWRFDMVD